MPIYEYRCGACDHEFEARQKMIEDPLKECPDCGKAELKKLISAVGFRLKGTGWYETDFKSKPKTDAVAKKTDAKPSSSSSSSSTAKSN